MHRGDPKNTDSGLFEVRTFQFVILFKQIMEVLPRGIKLGHFQSGQFTGWVLFYLCHGTRNIFVIFMLFTVQRQVQRG